MAERAGENDGRAAVISNLSRTAFSNVYASMTTVSVETKYFSSSRASLPALALQVTCLADSYMLWIGATEEPEDNVGHATLRGHLGKDWAVAMPPWNVRPHQMERVP
jgi:hypothetical protein